MALKTMLVEVTQRFEVSYDTDMFGWDDVLDTMEFTSFPDADAMEFLDGTTTYSEVGVV